MAEEEGITAKKKDFSEWYNQAVFAAGILDKRYDVKGLNVWMNYGYEIMLNLKNFWDLLFREHGIKEMYFPLLVPEKYCEQNPSWWEGFKDQAYWVKSSDEDKASHILRPTGEPAMYPMFSTWIRSHRDLPFRIYETVSSFRYETKHTRPLIRDREITLWHEIHTAHASSEEAEKEASLHQKLYDIIWRKCALLPLKVVKPEWEIFPGAVGAVEYYNYMPSGKVMENGSINNLGQAYSKKFNIKFRDKDKKEKYAWQLCTGNGARLLAAVIGVHGDDKGLVLPPEIAPVQVVIVPIYNNKTKSKVVGKAQQLKAKLPFRVEVDDRDEFTPGWKFNYWEMKGVPVRIELGEREIAGKTITVARRDTGKKEKIAEKLLEDRIKKLLGSMQNDLLENSKKQLEVAVHTAKNKKEISSLAGNGKIAKVHWCGSEKCWGGIKDIEEGIELFGTDLKKSGKGKCVLCGKATDTVGYVANTY